MQIVVALLLLAAGGGLYALHTKVCHKKECAAYQNGYNQAVKEVKIRQEAVEQYRAQLRPAVPVGVEDQNEMQPYKAAHGEVFPPDFINKLHRDGRAVARVK